MSTTTANAAHLSFRAKVYHFFFDPHGKETYAQHVDNWLAALIVANVAAMLFEIVPAVYEPYKRWFHLFDVFSIVIFTFEYCVRLYIAPEDPEFAKERYPRLKYALSLYALIDLLAILPFYLSAFVHIDLRILRLLRLLRLLKLFRVLVPALHEFVEANRGRTFRQKIYALVFPSPYGGKLHEYYDLFIVFWVLISVLAVILESVDSIYYNLAVEFVVLDTMAVLVFGFEYAFRIYSCVEDPRYKHWFAGRFRYARSPSAIIDLLAIIPFFLEVLLHHLVDLRFLRAFRLMRLFKLTRYTGSAGTLFTVVRRELPTIGTSAFIMMLLVVFAASFGYLLEHEAQPEKFENIPTAIYWAVITLASVGYGDISPITPMGRIMTVVMALLGIGIFAIPASILSSGFMHELQSQRQHLENELFAMLEDGVLSPEEREKVEALGKKLNISPQQLDTLIEKAKRESKDRNTKEHFVPPNILSANPLVAKAHFQILAEQMKLLAQHSDMAEVDRLVRSATDFDEHHHSLWNVLKRLEVGLPKEAQNDGKN
jgi:voltage-gated potassium channel Kch